jgi:hypothetical protein
METLQSRLLLMQSQIIPVLAKAVAENKSFILTVETQSPNPLYTGVEVLASSSQAVNLKLLEAFQKSLLKNGHTLEEIIQCMISIIAEHAIENDKSPKDIWLILEGAVDKMVNKMKV